MDQDLSAQQTSIYSLSSSYARTAHAIRRSVRIALVRHPMTQRGTAKCVTLVSSICKGETVTTMTIWLSQTHPLLSKAPEVSRKSQSNAISLPVRSQAGRTSTQWRDLRTHLCSRRSLSTQPCLTRLKNSWQGALYPLMSS